MGFAFQPTGCVKYSKECWNESHAPNGTCGENQRKTRRVETAGFQCSRGMSYEVRD
jgi:hypothetical protein